MCGVAMYTHTHTYVVTTFLSRGGRVRGPIGSAGFAYEARPDNVKRPLDADDRCGQRAVARGKERRGHWRSGVVVTSWVYA